MERTIFVKVGSEFVEKEIVSMSVVMSNAGHLFSGLVYAESTITTKDGQKIRLGMRNQTFGGGVCNSDIVYLTEKDVVNNKRWFGFSCPEIEERIQKRYNGKKIILHDYINSTKVSFSYYKWNGNSAERGVDHYGDCCFVYDFDNDTFKICNGFDEITPSFTCGKYKTEEDCKAANKVVIKRLEKKQEQVDKGLPKLYLVISTEDHFDGDFSVETIGVYTSKEKAVDKARKMAKNAADEFDEDLVEYIEDNGKFTLITPNYVDKYEVRRVDYHCEQN